MPFGADTPTPEFVGNSRVRGARSPPGTPRDPTTPSRAQPGGGGVLLRRARSPGGRCARRAVGGLPAAGCARSRRRVSGRRCARTGGRLPAAGVPGGRAAACGRVCPGGVPAGFRAAVPGGRCTRPAKKNRVFFRPLRACIRKRGLLFRKKTVDFSARQSDGCTHRAGNRP